MDAKNLARLLLELKACEDAVDWAEGKSLWQAWKAELQGWVNALTNLQVDLVRAQVPYLGDILTRIAAVRGEKEGK